MNNPKGETKTTDHEEGDHAQPINLVASRTVPSANVTAPSQPIAMRPHIEPPKPGLMTLYFRSPRPAGGQVIGPVVGSPSTQHFTAKQGQDFKNSGMSSWTVIRMPSSDIVQSGSTNSGGTGGILPSALAGGSRHMIPSHPVIAAGNSQSMASIIRGSHQGPPTGHVIHQQSFSSHVPRGPAAVASISAAPKSAVATPILRTPHASTTMTLASSSMMLHGPVRAKSPTLVNRTSTPPVSGSPQVVDLQKSNVAHPLSSGTTHISLGARTLDGSVVRTGPSHSSSITIAKPINISQPIVQHLSQVYDKGTLKTVSNLSSTTSSHLPGGGFTSSSSDTGISSRASSAGQGYSTSIMQLSPGHSLQTLRATHGNPPMHSVTSTVTPHQTLTVISAKSLMPANHSIALAAPTARSATPNASINVSGNASTGSNSSRPLSVSNSINPASIPVAKVYPQSSAPSRNVSDPSISDSVRGGGFMQQSVSTSGRPTTTAASLSEKQAESNSSVRFASLSKPPMGSSVTYATSPSTYLYHDQYPANLSMHPYPSNQATSAFTATQLRPVSFPQHSSGNSSSHSSNLASNTSQPVGSVMVAVDSRHHVAIHPSYGGKVSDMNTMANSSNSNSSNVSTAATSVVTTSYNNMQSQGNNHTSPRPSILRKRPSDSVSSVAKRNLSANLGCSEPISPRTDAASTTSMGFASVLSPKTNSEKLKDSNSNVASLTSDNLSVPFTILPPSSIKKEPGMSENHNADALLSLKEAHPMETSPRKKPRKQLLSANELIETHSSEGDENTFDPKIKIKKEVVEPEEEKTKSVTYYKRPNMSLLNAYRQPWKARHNHFIRYTDVKPKEEKKPTVNELANQKGILQQANGWKVYHLSAQMEEIIEVEERVHSRLSQLLAFVEKEPPSPRSRNSSQSEEDKIINKLTDLIKGNLQRSKIVQEQVAESKQQAIKVLDHKTNIIEMVNKYVSRRPLKKKEKL